MRRLTGQCGPTIAAYVGNAQQIKNTLVLCGPGQTVRLGPGVFSLTK